MFWDLAAKAKNPSLMFTRGVLYTFVVLTLLGVPATKITVHMLGVDESFQPLPDIAAVIESGAGRDLIVDHDYRPGAGSSVGTGLAMPDYRNTADGRREAATFCATPDFAASLDRLRRAGGEGAELPDYRIGYILRTGANWRSPIGDFRLVVDKGSPRNLVSFCEEGVRRISPTQFEVRHRNWRPTRDLNVLIVQPSQ